MASNNPFLQSPLDAVSEQTDEDTALLLGQQAAKPAAMPKIPSAPKAPADDQDVAPAPKLRRQRRADDYLPPEDLRPVFESAAQKYDVPANVIMALAHQESRYNPNAVGEETKWGRAKGMMQNLDATAKGLKINAFDPVQAIDAAAKQIRERLDNGMSMIDAVKEHFAGPDRKLWGAKTEKYGREVMEKVGKIGELLAGGDAQAAEVPAAAPDEPIPNDWVKLTPEQASAYEAKQANNFSTRMPRQQYENTFRANNPQASQAAVDMAMEQYDQKKDASVQQKVTSVDDKFARMGSPEAVFDEKLNKRLAGQKNGIVPQLPGKLVEAPKPEFDADAAARESQLEAAASYLGKSLKSGMYDLAGAGATVLDAINPFTLSPGDAAVLFKDDPAKLRQFQDDSVSMVLSRFAKSMNKYGEDTLGEMSDRAKRDYNGLKYATTDLDKAAYTSPVKVIGDALKSLPSTIAMAVSVYFTRGASLRAEQTALAAGMSPELARQAAIAAGSRAMASVGAASEGAVGYGQQLNQTTSRIDKLSDAEIQNSPRYQELLDQGFTPSTARAKLTADAAEQSGQIAGIVDAAVNKAGGEFLGKILTEGGKFLPRVMKGMANESATEFVQSAGEQVGENIAIRGNVNGKQDLSEGAGESALAGAMVGGLMGGTTAAVAGRGPDHAPAPGAPVPPAADQSLVTPDAAPAPQEAPPSAPAPAPSRAAGPLERSAENAAAQGAEQEQRVTVTTPQGQAGGVLRGYQEDADGNFTAEIVDDNGEVRLVSSADGVQITPEAPADTGPLTTSLSNAAEAHDANPAPAPEVPEAPPAPPAPPDYGSMDMEQLRGRLKYIAEQAKMSGGWNKMFMDERRKVEREIKAKTDAAKADSKPAEEPLESGPFDDRKVANKMLMRHAEATGQVHEVVEKNGKFTIQPVQEAGNGNSDNDGDVGGRGDRSAGGNEPAVGSGSVSAGDVPLGRTAAGKPAGPGKRRNAAPAAGANQSADAQPALNPDATTEQTNAGSDTALPGVGDERAQGTEAPAQAGASQQGGRTRNRGAGAGGKAAAGATAADLGSGVPDAGATADGQPALKDAHAGKWFSAEEKADAYILKHKLRATHRVEQTGRVRYEVKPKKAAPRADARQKALDAEAKLNAQIEVANQKAAARAAEKAAAAPVSEIDAAAHEAATSPTNDLAEPTEAQAEAGNYKKGHITVQGLDISVENPRGSTRSGKRQDGTTWSHEMSDHYGYVKRTVGADNEQVDVYVGPKPESKRVYVVDQLDQQSGAFDEHKAMVGFGNRAQAIAAYRSNFDKGWKVGPVKGMSVDEFKAWLKDGDTSEPAAAATAEIAPDAKKVPELAPPEPVEASAAPKKPAAKQKPAKVDTPAPEVSAPAAPIADFGAKLEGARKDLWAKFKSSMREALPDDVKDITLAKHFPEPNYEALLAEGVDVKTLAAMKAIRDEIPAKPRMPFKAKRWGEQVATLRDFANSMLSGNEKVDDVIATMRANGPLRKFADRIEMYADLGYPMFTKAKGHSIEKNHYSMYRGQTPPGGITKYTLSNNGRTQSDHDTREQAIEQLRTQLSAAPVAAGDKQVKLDLYRTTGSRDIIIGKKVGAGKYIDLKGGFTDVRSARTYLAENQAELEKLLEQKKDVRPERRSINDPRVGEDRRKGMDVTPEQFGSTFGFRGVQFGNYVEQKRRTADLNNAYDALMDLAELLGVPPAALSLNGTLGLAFGARGAGGKNAAAAHFEPGNIVINLTKTNGAGSLAHEWFHGLDNYFQRMRGATGAGHVTDSPTPRKKVIEGNKLVDDDSVRPEVLAAVKAVMDAIRASGMPKRSRDLDMRRTKDYWSTTHELAARAFESYIIDKAAEQGMSNDYLANIISEDAHKVMDEMLGSTEPFPYPTRAEAPAINAAFDKLFDVIETRNEGGKPVMYSVSADTGVETRVTTDPIERSDDAQYLLDFATPKMPNDTTIRAVIDGKQVGYLDLQVADDGKTAAVREIHVDPEHRRKGVATDLMNAAKEQGYAIAPSENVTEAGAAFRKAYDGPRYSVADDRAATAISELMAAKEGETVITRPDIGDITVMYGDGKSGLSHIARRRGTEFMKRLPALLRDGGIYTKADQPGRIFIGNDRDEAVVRLDWNGETKNWLLSAYEKYPDLKASTSAQPAPVAAPAGPQFNKARLRKAVTKGVLGQVIASMIEAGTVVLHDGPATLPKEVGKNVKGVQALTMPDGTIHLVGSNLNERNARPVMLHEAFHQGAEKLIGTKQWSELMGRAGSLYRQSELSSGKAREFFDKARARVAAAKAKGAVPARMEVEEFMAYAIEEYESAPASVRKWVDDLIGLVKAWMVARFGKQLGAVTPAQLSAFARVAIMDAAYQRRGEIFGPLGEVFSVGEERTIEVDGVRRPITNSKGQLVGHDFAAQQAFWKWFGDSKVVDSDGRPLVAYHGTIDADITEFKKGPTGTFGDGIYFATDPSIASFWAGDRESEGMESEDGGSVYPAYLRITNPASETLAGEMESLHGSETSQVLTEQGYDGVMTDDGEIVAFTPDQVKSATGNDGTFDPENNDIRYSVAADAGAPASADADTSQDPNGLTPPEQGLLRRVQAQLQDNLNRLKQVQERIAEVSGNQDLGKSDYYGAETNRPGRIAARLEDARDQLTGPLMKRLAKSGHTPEQLSELLHAQHAEERNNRVAEINDAMPDGGSGMTTAKANEILARYADNQELQALAQQARDIAKATLDLKLAYGLIKSEDHEALSSAYENYVPLKGDGEYGPKVKRAMGHEERDEHILDNIARDYDQAVVVGEKNLARQSLLRMVLQFADKNLWTVGAPPKGRYVAGKVYNIVHRGQTVGSFTSRSQVDAFLEAKGAQAGQYQVLDSNGDAVAEFTKPLQDNEIMVYLKGDPIRIQIHDEALAAQLRPLNGQQLHPILEFMRGVNRYLSKIYTGYNPAFILRNTARDAMTGTINMLGNQGAGMAAKAWTKYPSALKAMGQWAATKKVPDGQVGNYLNEYRQHGGKVGASWMSDLEEQGKTLSRMYDDAYGASGYARDGKVGKAAAVAGRKIVGGMAHVVEIANQATENALRLSLFIALRESGVSPGKAAQAAKGVTVDFDRKGTSTAALGAIYLFFNPAVQGTANAMKTLIKGRHRNQAWSALGGLAALGFYAAAKGMGDDKDRWLGEGWETRSKNFMMNIGDHQVRVPLSQEFAPIYAMGAAMAEAMHGESKPMAAARAVSSFIDAYFPLQGAVKPESDNHALDLATAAAPTLTKPFLESAMNRNSFGSQIVPESQNTKDRPDNLKMTRGVKGSAYDSVAQGIAAAGEKMGAGPYENDITKVSPETLKYFWRTYTGGLGQFVGDVAGMARMGAEDPGQLTTSDVPFVKDFVKTNDVKPIRGRYYDLARDAQAAATEFKQAKKAGDGDAMDAIMKDDTKAKMVSLGKMVLNTNKAVAALRDEAVDVNQDKDLTSSQKREKLKELEQQEEALYRAAIDAFK